MAKDNSINLVHENVDDVDFSNVNALIVGGTGGIGRAVSLFLASKGAKVSVVGRVFRDEGVENVKFIQADLSSMKAAQKVAQDLDVAQFTHVLMTTGIFAAKDRQESKEGLELDLAVSYMSRLVILREIADRLKPDVRVFIMGFPGNGQVGQIEDQNFEKSYSLYACHMNTVAGNECLVLDSAKRYPHLKTFGLNPGFIKTDIRSNLMGKDSYLSRITEYFIGWFCQSAEDYAAKVAELMVNKGIENKSGSMFDNGANGLLATKELTPDYVEKFIQASTTLLNEKVGIDYTA